MNAPFNPKPIFDFVGPRLTPPGWTANARLIPQLDAAIAAAFGILPEKPQVGISEQDFKDAANMLKCSVAQIKAVWEVECQGSGWFTDVRADVLAADGPGGFIDGDYLLKILFEAKWFGTFTDGKYHLSHPNLSSRTWNRGLYTGGQGEWFRLHKAMLLDREAALKSASVGAPQIMGFNHKLAGCPTVEGFWTFMKASESNHLIAFCQFIKNSGLEGALRKISNIHADCAPFAKGYNGAGYYKNQYNVKIARAHAKYA